VNHPRQILALDLAARSGWAMGYAKDAVPTSGTIRFAREGASMAAVLSNCRLFLRDFLSANPEIGIVVFEAPLVPGFKTGKTTFAATRQLIGLCAVVEEMIYTYNDLDRRNAPFTPILCREARVSDVRNHFIGKNPKRDIAKAMTIAQCQRLGWKPLDDNEADALALWDYQRSLLLTQDLLNRAK
jgi:hypothetical protein